MSSAAGLSNCEILACKNYEMSEKDIWLRFGTSTHARKLYVREMSVGSFSNDDGDGNENVKKAIGLLSKTTSLHVHHAFLYISLPLLHDYDVKMPSFTFYGGRKTRDDKLFFLFLNLSAPKEINSREIGLH